MLVTRNLRLTIIYLLVKNLNIFPSQASFQCEIITHFASLQHVDSIIVSQAF